MNYISVFMAAFSVIAALDYMLGNHLGLGREFEKGFLFMGNMLLSMAGMIILAPWLGRLMMPLFDWFYAVLGIDPSILPAMLFANDMGGASLSDATAKSSALAAFNGLVVSSMMGCTISFTIPVTLTVVKEKQHPDLLTGILCGIVTVPVGCFFAGLLCRLPLGLLLADLVPLVLFSGLIAGGLIRFPDQCVKLMGAFGYGIKVCIVIGLVLGSLQFLLGITLIEGLATLEESAMICLNASIVMSGAFPFLRIVSRLTARPIRRLGAALGINEKAAFGLVSSLATSLTTFYEMSAMDPKGVLLNAAFSVSGAFTFASHLAFTLAYNERMVLPMIVGKLIAGVTAVALANLVWKKLENRRSPRPGDPAL